MMNLAVSVIPGLARLRIKRSWWGDGDACSKLEFFEWVRYGSCSSIVACRRWDRRDRDSNLHSSHRRCQLTGIIPGKSHGQGPWVSHRERTGWTILVG